MKRDNYGMTKLGYLFNKLFKRSPFEPFYGFSKYHKEQDLLLVNILKSKEAYHIFFKRKEIIRILKWI